MDGWRRASSLVTATAFLRHSFVPSPPSPPERRPFASMSLIIGTITLLSIVTHQRTTMKCRLLIVLLCSLLVSLLPKRGVEAASFLTPPSARTLIASTTSSSSRSFHSLWARRGGGDTKKTKAVKKQDLPSKICVVCGRPFTYRKKWERCWDEVTCCSKACNAQRRSNKKGTDFDE